MDVAAVILIGIGVVIGGLMATWGLQKEHIPKGLAMLHGGFVGVGLILLLIYALTTDSHHKHWDSITIFGMAAVIGLYLLERDLRKREMRPWLLIVHGLLGLGGIAWITVHLLH